jgi:cell division protein FtsN
MRVTCPNCDQRVLLDAARLSDAPLQTICARCGVPYRISLLCEKATVNAAAHVAHVNAQRDAEKSAHAARRDDSEDVLALPREESHVDTASHSDPLSEPTCVVLDLGDACEALRRARTPTRSEDKYRLGARLLNVSPLRLLLACVVFVALIGFCDLLLAPSEHASGDREVAAALQNQATNRAATRSRRDEASADDTRDDDTRDDARDTRDADSETPDRANEDSAAAKPAPVSNDPVTPTANSVAPASFASASTDSVSTAPASITDHDQTTSAVSFTNARHEIPAAVVGGEQPTTKFTLQLASYRVEEEAQKLVAGLQAAGFEARVVIEQHSKRPWYCVQTKTFDTRSDAERHLADLRAKNFALSYTVREVE